MSKEGKKKKHYGGFILGALAGASIINTINNTIPAIYNIIGKNSFKNSIFILPFY